MNYFYDRALRQFVDASGSLRPLRSLRFMRDEDREMAINIQDNGVAWTSTGTTELTFGIKAAPGETSTTLAIIEPENFSEASDIYTGTIELNGESLSDLLGSDFSLKLFSQIVIIDDSGTHKSDIIPVIMGNDIIRGNEGDPTSMPDPNQYVLDRITNSSVNTAIATNPSATRTAAGLVIGTDVAAQGDTRIEPQVKSSSFTAANGETYHVVASATVTDPSPVEGKGYTVFVRNGTATAGGTAHATAGTVIIRTFHAGSWANNVYQDKATTDASYDPAGSADAAEATAAADATAKVNKLASEVPNLINWQPNFIAANAAVRPARVLALTDSLGTQIQAPPNAAITGIIGCGRIAGATGVTDNVTDANWIAPYHTIAIGGTVAYHAGTPGSATIVPIAVDRLMLLYIAEPGAGTFDLQTSTNSGSTWTTVATINAANATQVGMAPVYNLGTSNNPSYISRITNVTGGPVKIIGGPGLYNSTGTGVIWCANLARTGGLDLVNFSGVPDAIFTPIWTAVAPDLVISCYADAPYDWQDEKLALTNVVTNGTNTITFAAYPPRAYADGKAALPFPNVGDSITGANIPAGTRIASHTQNSTTATLTQAATGSGTSTASIRGAWVDFYARCKAAYANTDFVQLSMNPASATALSGHPIWTDGASYSIGNRVVMLNANASSNGPNGVFVALTNHTASSTNKPNTGASWATAWVQDIVDPAAAAAGALSCLEQATAQRAWAERTGETFLNGFAPFRGWVEGYQKGLLEGDLIHPTTLGHSYKNLTLWSSLNISHMFLGGFGGSGLHPLSMPFLNNPTSSNAVVRAANLILLAGSQGGLSFADRNAPTDGAGNITIYNADRLLYLGNAIRTGGVSGWRGIHPQNNGDSFGGMGSMFFRAHFGGMRVEHRQVSADTSFLATDCVIEVTANSPVITLADSKALNSSLSNFTNLEAGAKGGLVIVSNSGSGVPTIQGIGIARSSGATTNGSTTITFASNGASPNVGDYVYGTGIPVDTRIVSTSQTLAVISNAATATNTGLTFTFREAIVGGASLSLLPGGSVILQSTGSGYIKLADS